MTISDIGQWVARYQAIIAVAIAVIGWLVQYYLNVKAQQKNILNQITNEARRAIIKELSEYKYWLSEIYAISIVVTQFTKKMSEEWISASARIEVINNDRKTGWHGLLEEYKIIFPETRQIKEKLYYSEIKIAKFYSNTVELIRSNSLDKEKIAENVSSNMNFIMSQISLVEDLMIYIQNKSLSKITGNKIPDQELAPNTPMIKMDNGMLIISSQK